MTEYYTMKECFDACGDDDIPKAYYQDGCWNINDLTKKEILKKRLFAIPVEYALHGVWQIKRAEPKVMTAEEVEIKVWRERHGDTFGTSNRQYGLWCAEEGIKNGRLSYYLYVKEHLDEIRRLLITCHPSVLKHNIEAVLKKKSKLREKMSNYLCLLSIFARLAGLKINMERCARLTFDKAIGSIPLTSVD